MTDFGVNRPINPHAAFRDPQSGGRRRGPLRRLGRVYGARMTGGGFGGCAVALVEADVRREAARRYQAATGRAPDVWVTTAGSGVGAWSLDSAPAA